MTITSDGLAEVLAAAAEEFGVPGASAGVLWDDGRITAVHGVANAESRAPVITSTLFQVGSITKPMTATALMLLEQEGRLSLDDPVARHLPDLGPATGLDTEAITIELAISHRSGFDGDHLFVVQSTDLAALADARRLFEPGTGFSYSNAGFSIAGAVIEAVSGESYEAFVRKRLLKPLGMRSACFTADDAITSPVAVPHWVLDDTAHVLRRSGWQPGWELLPADRPAGGLIASIDDLLTWCRFQWTRTADGNELLTAANLERLHTPVVEATAYESYALDWTTGVVDGVPTIGHGGVTVGYISDLLVIPEQRFAVVSLTNGTSGAGVNQAVRRWALEHGPGLIERDPEPDPQVGAAADVSRYEGRYEDGFAVRTITAAHESDTFVMTSSRRDVHGWQPPLDDPMTFALVSPDHAVSLHAPGFARTIRFGLEPSGSAPADWLLVGLRRAPRID